MDDEKKRGTPGEPERGEKFRGDVRVRSPFLKKLENYWYHYKWPTLIGVFALIVAIVSISQCAAKGKGDDAYIMYAGNRYLSPVDRRAMEKTVAGQTKDRNGDGKVVVAINSYLIYTGAELGEGTDAGHRAEESAKAHDQFTQEILSGEATICLLSPALFEEVAKEGGFLPVSEYAPEMADGEGAVRYRGTVYGIRLSSLNLSEYGGFSCLPEDTILCARRVSTMASLFGKRRAEELHKANLEVITRLIRLPALPDEKQP